MEKEQFHIGCEFYTGSGKWRCTDVGTRVVVAIKLDENDASLNDGPPYSVEEHVFDEYDFGGCDLEDRFAEFRELYPEGFGKKYRRNRLVPCSRCSSTEPAKLGVIISCRPKRLGGNGVTRVCTDCKTDQDKSCIRFGKFKWICECGANIWDDDQHTDRACLSCGRHQDQWCPVDNT